jgi:integrase
MSLYKIGSVWHYSFYWGGRRYRGSTQQRLRARAERVQAEAMAKVREQPNVRLTGRTPLLSEFAQRFLKWVNAADLAPKTKAYYHNGWRVLSKTKLARMRLADIRNEHVAVLQVKGTATGNNCRRTLRRMLSAALEWGLLGATPKIKLLKQVRRSLLIDGVREAQLLKFAKKPLSDVLVIMQDTGLRPDEVLRMRWEHIDWQARTIFNPYGKTERARRRLPMSDRVRQTIEQRRKKDQSQGWVFPSPVNTSRLGHFSLSAIEHQFKRARTAAGLPEELVLYCARHTYATDAMARTGNLAAVMDSLGHSNAQTTMIYQHQGLEQLREAINERNREHAREQKKLVKKAKQRGQNLGQSTENGAAKKSVSA